MDLSKTENKVYVAAKSLFWKYGFKKVSIEDICQKAGISKMTFYRNFRNKSDLAYKMLDLELSRNLTIFENTIKSDLPFKEKIHKMMLAKNENIKESSFEFINEILNHPEEELRNLIDHYTHISITKIKDFLTKAKENNDIRKDINIDLLMMMINSFSQKMQDPVFLSIFKSPEEAVNELNNFFFFGIMPES